MAVSYSAEFQEVAPLEITERDTWWTGYIRDTPNPGSYEVASLLDELNSSNVNKSYGFKSSGRKLNADPSRKGHYLMPGLYNTNLEFGVSNQKDDFLSKSTSRENTSALVVGIQDKHMLKSDISPWKYAKQFEEESKIPSKYGVFKSKSERFPTIHFKPKEGPSPGQYEVKKKNGSVNVTSSFLSKTPRFKINRKLNTPGPGAYTKTIQYPMTTPVRDVNTKYHMFFPPGVF